LFLFLAQHAIAYTILTIMQTGPAIAKPAGIASLFGKTEYIGGIETSYRKSRGQTISGGLSGLIERLPSGDIVKSPWLGSRATQSRSDITLEYQIYKRLGPHPRLVRIIAWDSEECALTIEYMSNGCLKDYLCAHNDEILETQRLRWIREAAEGVQLLHSAGVFHCDIAPKNFLLDADLSLKIADFGSSSLDGSRPSGCASTRFITPDFTFRTPPTVQEDLYALGSTMYNIMTGKAPYQELESDEVERRYCAQDFPDITDIPCGKIIQRCWRSDVVSAQEVCDFVERYINKETLQG